MAQMMKGGGGMKMGPTHQQQPTRILQKPQVKYTSVHFKSKGRPFYFVKVEIKEDFFKKCFSNVFISRQEELV